MNKTGYKSKRRSRSKAPSVVTPRLKRAAAVSEAIGQMIERLGGRDRIREQDAVLQWSRAMPRDIAKMTEAISISKGILTVKVANASYRQELSLSKETIIAALNEHIGRTVVTDILFK